MSAWVCEELRFENYNDNWLLENVDIKSETIVSYQYNHI